MRTIRRQCCLCGNLRIAAPAAAAHRYGFSLFEVVIALVIFVASAAVIGQLISSGVRGAVRSRLESQAVLRCESKLAEITAGVISMQAASDMPFTDDSAWTWSAAIQSGPHPDLYLVQVKVSHPSSSQMGDLSYTLSRLVRDPNATLAMTVDQTTKQQTSQKTSSSSTTGTSSSTGGSR